MKVFVSASSAIILSLGLGLAVAASEKKAAESAPSLPKLVPTELFAAPDGLEVTVWAASPMFSNPTNMDFDAQGRMWIAEGVNYRSHATRRPEGDRIMVLEDSDGDGVADKSSVFVQDPELQAPLGVAVFDNKVVVSQPPNLLVYTDVNRDAKFDPAVDKREVLLTGFNGRQHDHSLHSVTAGPDGLWYWNQGNTGAQFEDKSGKKFSIGSPYNHKPGTTQVADNTEIAGMKSDDGSVWISGFAARMNPDGTAVDIIGHNFRNSYEQIVTSFGDVYQSDNDDPPACRVSLMMEYGNAGFASLDGKRSWRNDQRPGQPTAVAQWRQEDPGSMPAGDVYGGGSPTGVGYYENGALGDKWNGLLLACEAGRNVVFGYLPKPDGAGMKLERFDFLTSNKEKKFAGSDFLGGNNSVNHEVQTLFRPSDVTVGPDGAIYVADWFDPRVGGHADLDDSTSGTIYRIAPKGFKSTVPKVDLQSTEGQLLALQSPAVNVRHAGFVKLKEQGAKAVPAVSALLSDRNSYIAARAVWLLAQMGNEGVAKVTPLLESKDESKRLVAYRALRRAGHQVVSMAARMASDSSPAVRREVALTMRNVPVEQSRDILLKVARGFDGRDRSYLEAFGTGCFGKEKAMFQAVSKAMGTEALKWSEPYAWLAWRLHQPESVGDFKKRALASSLTPAQNKLMMDAIAFVPTQQAADAMIELAAAEGFRWKAEAMWWLFNRKGNDWKDFGIDAALKSRGLYDPATVTLTSFVTPEPPKTASTLPAVADIQKLKGDAKAGMAAVAVCYGCHKVGSQGIDFGPDLTMFGKTQTSEVVLGAIIAPSADIAHGYEGQRIETKDGLVIEGMVLSTGNPVIIRSMGGLTQTVPRERIKQMKKMDRSLMLSAEMMGLDAQKLADIVAYLQSEEIK
ncbi:dehydrogenase [Phragmitibacter flavus]|uniref:Dehydrogenase n=1 Tax=Phragmitibacter flavus TaxID=2576071 RepID=A0A5R8K9J4_9BACT|nr:PVC-type heme-binding CxxCH protein [Phragmitibacter flavus]TLD68970.1 dehydrogenase [Phragmitibacter flavus]